MGNQSQNGLVSFTHHKMSLVGSVEGKSGCEISAIVTDQVNGDLGKLCMESFLTVVLHCARHYHIFL